MSLITDSTEGANSLLTKRVLDPKARLAKLWELSSQGTESSPKNCQFKYNVSTTTSFATNDIYYPLVFTNFY